MSQSVYTVAARSMSSSDEMGSFSIVYWSQSRICLAVKSFMV